VSSERDLAAALDDCLERVRAGASLEECLARHPRLRRDLAPLLDAALVLWEAAPAPTGAEERAGRRAGLIQAMGRVEAAKPRAGGLSWGRLLAVPAVAAAVAIALLLGLGTLQAPDEAEAATLLTVIRGQVFVETAQGIVAGQTGMLLRAGDRVLTGPGAGAVLTFFDGSSVTLDSDTELAIRSVAVRAGRLEARLTQQRGSTWTYAPPASNAAQIQIDTPAASVQSQEAAFLTTVQTDGRTEVGTRAGAVEVSGGGARAAVPEGHTAAVDVGSSMPPAVAVRPDSPQELVLLVRGPVSVILTDPASATAGVVASGLPVNQIPGASVSVSGSEVLIRLPEPKGGAYKLIVQSSGEGRVEVTGGVSGGERASVSFQVAAGESWSVAFGLAGGDLKAGDPEKLESFRPNVALPETYEKLKATPATALPQTKTPTRTPTPSDKASPTPSPSPSPSPTATPALSPANASPAAR
jgi:hypothetical protein